MLSKKDAEALIFLKLSHLFNNLPYAIYSIDSVNINLIKLNDHNNNHLTKVNEKLGSDYTNYTFDINVEIVIHSLLEGERKSIIATLHNMDGSSEDDLKINKDDISNLIFEIKKNYIDGIINNINYYIDIYELLQAVGNEYCYESILYKKSEKAIILSLKNIITFSKVNEMIFLDKKYNKKIILKLNSLLSFKSFLTRKIISIFLEKKEIKNTNIDLLKLIDEYYLTYGNNKSTNNTKEYLYLSLLNNLRG